MKKMFLAVAIGCGLGAFSATQIAGPVLAQSSDERANIYEQLDLFGDIFERIRAQYVEEVDEAELIEAAINGMLTSLDPHSSYLSPDAAAEMRFQTRGEFGGLGIEVTQKDGLFWWSLRWMIPPLIRQASKRAILSPTWMEKAFLD